jgi:hypothetical protein
MSKEIKAGFNLRFDNGQSYIEFQKSTLIDVTGSQYLKAKQAIGTSEEALVLGDISPGGLFAAVNTDASAVISLRAGTGLQDFVSLKAGESCIFRTHTGSTPYAISDTAGAELEYVIIEA